MYVEILAASATGKAASGEGLGCFACLVDDIYNESVQCVRDCTVGNRERYSLMPVMVEVMEKGDSAGRGANHDVVDPRNRVELASLHRTYRFTANHLLR